VAARSSPALAQRAAEVGVSGFIVPDDRVDVVVATQGGDETKTVIMGVNPLP